MITSAGRTPGWAARAATTSEADVAANEAHRRSAHGKAGVDQCGDEGALVGGNAGDGVEDQAWAPSGGATAAELKDVLSGPSQASPMPSAIGVERVNTPSEMPTAPNTVAVSTALA